MRKQSKLHERKRTNPDDSVLALAGLRFSFSPDRPPSWTIRCFVPSTVQREDIKRVLWPGPSSPTLIVPWFRRCDARGEEQFHVLGQSHLASSRATTDKCLPDPATPRIATVVSPSANHDAQPSPDDAQAVRNVTAPSEFRSHPTRDARSNISPPLSSVGILYGRRKEARGPDALNARLVCARTAYRDVCRVRSGRDSDRVHDSRNLLAMKFADPACGVIVASTSLLNDAEEQTRSSVCALCFLGTDHSGLTRHWADGQPPARLEPGSALRAAPEQWRWTTTPRPAGPRCQMGMFLFSIAAMQTDRALNALAQLTSTEDLSD
uniref:Uncharacterized protein n=1 Tax=Mycena chlorophos TaxID=658473 RepID=A0ABQ0L3K8_MYCCL|nr:predicted protein [Mycena chlorophos]